MGRQSMKIVNFSSSDIASFFVEPEVVSLRGKHLQIVRAIVVGVVVDMMHNFTGLDGTTELLLGKENVLVDVAVGMGPWMVGSIDAATAIHNRDAAFPTGVTFTRAPVLCRFCSRFWCWSMPRVFVGGRDFLTGLFANGVAFEGSRAMSDFFRRLFAAPALVAWDEA